MDFANRSPFPAVAFRQLDRNGGFDAVLAVRATFQLCPDNAASLAATQAPLQWEDEYEADPCSSPLLRATDLSPYKDGTDVTFLGTSYAPGATAQSSWTCGIRIGPSVEKVLRVTGPRYWQPRLIQAQRTRFGRQKGAVVDGWELTKPMPVLDVDLTWALAVGGARSSKDASGNASAVHPANPIGIGLLHEHPTAKDQRVPAPQIEAPDVPLRDWRNLPAPEGFGPIAPFWETRLRHAGSYDQAWLDHRAPLPPDDFDFEFWNCAHPDLIVRPFLRGDEAFMLARLHPHYEVFAGQLPGCYLTARVYWPEGMEEINLNLDGVHFDFRDTREQVFLTFRTRFSLRGVDQCRIVLRDVDATGRRWKQIEEVS